MRGSLRHQAQRSSEALRLANVWICFKRASNAPLVRDRHSKPSGDTVESLVGNEFAVFSDSWLKPGGGLRLRSGLVDGETFSAIGCKGYSKQG